MYAVNAVPRTNIIIPAAIFRIYSAVAEGDAAKGSMFFTAMSTAENNTNPDITVYVILVFLFRANSRIFINAQTKITENTPKGISESMSSVFIESRISVCIQSTKSI